MALQFPPTDTLPEPTTGTLWTDPNGLVWRATVGLGAGLIQDFCTWHTSARALHHNLEYELSNPNHRETDD